MSSSHLRIEEPEDEHTSDTDGHITDESAEQSGDRIRRRIKVRKKVRIRKKTDPKKKLRKMLERTFWIALVVGFIAALIIMFAELDIKDPKQKKLQQKTTPSGKTY
ncbi:MAG: hypothetical protein ACKOYC_03470 [Bacteroidota bacterium]